MKPFDLEAAKAGKSVVTDSGLPVRIIAFDRKGTDQPLVTLVQTAAGVEELLCYNVDGTCPHRNGAFHLRMAPTKREGWVNIYPSDVSRYPATTGFVHPTPEAADSGPNVQDRIACVRIEWAE